MKGMTMKRIGIAVAIAACVAMSAPAISAADTIRIGAILSLTGNAAEVGLNMRDGILLAVDEINKRGGVNGSRIDMAIEDSKSDPKAAIEAVHVAIATVHGINFLLTWNCAHIANPHWLRKLAQIITACGYAIPMVCTPQALLEGKHS